MAKQNPGMSPLTTIKKWRARASKKTLSRGIFSNRGEKAPEFPKEGEKPMSFFFIDY